MYDLLAELKFYTVERMILSPTQWKAYVDVVDLDWKEVKFEEKNKSIVPPDKQGVYTFVVKPNIAKHPGCSYLLYVGMTSKQGLQTRFSQYLQEKKGERGRPLVKKMLQMWEEHLWFYYATVDEIDKIHEIEKKLLDAYIPPINKDFPGEVKKPMGAW
jgi:hypothetical protein